MKFLEINPASIIECIASCNRETHAAILHLEGLGIAFHEPHTAGVQAHVHHVIAGAIRDRFADTERAEAIPTLKLIHGDFDYAVREIARARNAVACLARNHEQASQKNGGYANSPKSNLVSSL